MTKLIYGVGWNDGKYPTKVNGKINREYQLWQNLLARCYRPSCQQRQPTYIGCQISENFKSYSYFHEWCQEQTGFSQKGFQLDKDIVSKGNKFYSEDLCVFLPSELNLLLIARRALRGNLPIGVAVYRGKFRASCSTDKPSSHLGDFHTVEQAFNTYKQAKEAFIKLQAQKWQDTIDPRAYAALIAYEVLITD